MVGAMSPSFPFLSCSAAPLQWSCSSPWLAAQNHTWSRVLRRPPISTSKTFSPLEVPLQPPSGQGRPAGGSPSVSSGPGLASVGEIAHSFWIAVQILLGFLQFSMTRRTDAGDCSVADVTQVQHGNMRQAKVYDKIRKSEINTSSLSTSSPDVIGLFLIWKVEASLESSSSKTPAILLYLASFSGEIEQPLCN